MSNKQITIKKTSVGKRLDKFLVEKLSGISRSQIQKLIKESLIKINNQPAKVHTFLKEGDKIIIEQKEGKIKKIEAIRTEIAKKFVINCRNTCHEPANRECETKPDAFKIATCRR